MASNRHLAAVEEGELNGSPPPSQHVIPAPAPQQLSPAARPQHVIPTPTPHPAPPTQQLAGHIHRIRPPAPVRKPFLWGVEEKILGQGHWVRCPWYIRPLLLSFEGLARLASFHAASPFNPHSARTISISSIPCPSGRSTSYSRGYVMRAKPTSWRRLTRARYTSPTKHPTQTSRISLSLTRKRAGSSSRWSMLLMGTSASSCKSALACLLRRHSSSGCDANPSWGWNGCTITIFSTGI